MAAVRSVTLLLAVAVAAVVAGPAGAGPGLQRGLEVRLARALAVPHVRKDESGAVVLDLETGQPLFVRNGSSSLAPASNEKLAVTFGVLTALGPEYRIETDVLGEGAQDGSVWQGDLVLKGYGDPTLSTADLRSLARQVRADGITRVTGGVRGDATWFDTRRTAPGWKPSFYIFESPPLSALAVDRSGAADPALAAARLFRAALVSAGVAVTGAARLGTADDQAVPLGSVLSRPLASIVSFMDHESDNYTAELLLKQLGAQQADVGTTAAGAVALKGLLADAGVPLDGVRIVDGSGLSQLDRLTPNALVALLQVMWKDVELRPLVMSSLPLAGVNGTLAHRMRSGPAHAHVVAKTGTTSQASALSGFVRRRYAFAVLQNGHPVSSWWARIAQDRFATVLASLP
jgi:D-alanyl-D-alanine carboxypeptidase/D-alanyl-D-alanine-endopeptidase (penicillin-binding protein 4)